MSFKVSTLKNIRLLSLLAIVSTLVAGFLLTITEFQAFIVSPLLLLIQMSFFGYADFILDSQEEPASKANKVHYLPSCCFQDEQSDKKPLKAA